MWPILAQANPEAGGFRDLIDSVARTPLSQVVAFVAICTVIRLALYPFLKKTPSHLRSGGYVAGRIADEFLDAVIYAGVFVFLLIRPFAVQAFLIPSASMTDTLLINDFIVANKAIYRYSEPKIGDIIVFKPPVYATKKDQQDENGEVKVDFIKRCVGLPGDKVEVKNGELYRNDKKAPEPFLADRNKHMNFDWKLVEYHGVKKEWEGRYIPVIMTDEPGSGPNYNIGTGISKEYAVGAIPEDASTDEAWVNSGDWKRSDQLSTEEQTVLTELRNLPAAKVPKGYVLMMGDNRNESFDGRAWGLVPRDNVIGRSEFIWLPFSRWRITR